MSYEYVNEQLTDAASAIAAKDAEIARLRDALAKIVEQQTQHPRDDAGRVEWHAYWRDTDGKRHDIARAALAQVAEVGK